MHSSLMVFEFTVMKALFFTILVLLLASSLSWKFSYRFPELVRLNETSGNKHAAEPVTSFAIKPRDIPILCYHNIRIHGKVGEYTILAERFKEHMKLLADSGYHSILPEQLYNYLTNGNPLPERPVMLSFDDSHSEHFTIAAPVLEQYGFSGVFFIMNITIGKPGYLSKAEIKALTERGHAIGLHSWDHQLVRKLDRKGWETQVTEPKSQLESITGKPVVFFAYPSGVWNESSVTELKTRGVKAAFQLYGKYSVNDRLYTIRRIIVPGTWTASQVQKEMKLLFH
jgi:peptidoglycan/xylan/chitin deacetylase (PgdA/CDA1 family)